MLVAVMVQDPKFVGQTEENTHALQAQVGPTQDERLVPDVPGFHQILNDIQGKVVDAV